MEPDADQAWVEFERSLSDMTRNSDMIGVIQAAYRAGYRAGLASPSEEEVLNAAWQIGQNHYWTLGGHHDGKWLDLRGYAALAALRTTKEGE